MRSLGLFTRWTVSSLVVLQNRNTSNPLSPLLCSFQLPSLGLSVPHVGRKDLLPKKQALTLRISVHRGPAGSICGSQNLVRQLMEMPGKFTCRRRRVFWKVSFGLTKCCKKTSLKSLPTVNFSLTFWSFLRRPLFTFLHALLLFFLPSSHSFSSNPSPPCCVIFTFHFLSFLSFFFFFKSCADLISYLHQRALHRPCYRLLNSGLHLSRHYLYPLTLIMFPFIFEESLTSILWREADVSLSQSGLSKRWN